MMQHSCSAVIASNAADVVYHLTAYLTYLAHTMQLVHANFDRSRHAQPICRKRLEQLAQKQSISTIIIMFVQPNDTCLDNSYPIHWEFSLDASPLIQQHCLRATPRCGPCELRQIFRGYALSAHFYSKCTRKCLTFEMKVNVTEYNNHIGANQWRISTPVKVIWRIVAIALTVSDILLFKFVTLNI